MSFPLGNLTAPQGPFSQTLTGPLKIPRYGALHLCLCFLVVPARFFVFVIFVDSFPAPAPTVGFRAVDIYSVGVRFPAEATGSCMGQFSSNGFRTGRIVIDPALQTDGVPSHHVLRLSHFALHSNQYQLNHSM